VKKKVIIIGATGFIGQYVSQLLRVREDVCVYEGRDIGIDLLNIRSIKKAINSVKPNVIVNLAAISDLDKYPLTEIYETNANGIVRIIELLQEINFQGRYINTSSSLVYGIPLKIPVSESAPLRPRHHYSCAKAMIDNLISIVGDELDILSVRPFNCIGFGQGSRYVLPKIIAHFQRKDQKIELGSIDNKRDFVDVRDVARMYELVCFSRPKTGNLINFCSGVGTSVRDLVYEMENISGHEMHVVESENLFRRADSHDVIGDFSTLDRLGFSLNYGIKDSLRWLYEL